VVAHHNFDAFFFGFFHDLLADIGVAEHFDVDKVNLAIVENVKIEVSVVFVGNVSAAAFGLVSEGHENRFVLDDFIDLLSELGKFFTGNFTDVVRAELDHLKFRTTVVVLNQRDESFGRLSSRGSNDLRTAFTDSDALDFQDFDGFFVPAGFVVQGVDRHHLFIAFQFCAGKGRGREGSSQTADAGLNHGSSFHISSETD